MTQRIVSKLIESNVFVVSKDDECIIFDAAAEVNQVKSVVGNKKVVGVFLTHGHYDHAYYVLEYAKEFNCKIFCSRAAMEYLQNPEYNYSNGNFKIEDFSNFVFLTGEGPFTIGKFNICFHQLGGHSKGDMCFVYNDEIFVGDVVMGRDVGRMDLYGGDRVEMLKSLKFLLQYDYKIMHSGHGIDNTKDTQDKVITLWQRFLSR